MRLWPLLQGERKARARDAGAWA
eukprot:COSAG06_NODE_56258_length_285_cov_1.419355_1_plen_22_part_01